MWLTFRTSENDGINSPPAAQYNSNAKVPYRSAYIQRQPLEGFVEAAKRLGISSLSVYVYDMKVYVFSNSTMNQYKLYKLLETTPMRDIAPSIIDIKFVQVQHMYVTHPRCKMGGRARKFIRELIGKIKLAWVKMEPGESWSPPWADPG